MKRTLNISVCILAVVTALAGTARAEETVTTTVEKGSVRWVAKEKTMRLGKTRLFRLEDFDDNHNGVISRREVGAHMFKMFDTDGNEIIDNKEYERKAVLSIVPVEKSLKIAYDFDGDGKPDEVRETGVDFLKETQLTRFDPKGDGLSPREFMRRDFLRADVNRDHAVDQKEWQGSYDALVDKKNQAKALYNK